MKILLVNGGSLDRMGVCLFTYQWAHSLVTAFPEVSVIVYFKLVIVDKTLLDAFQKDGIKVIAGNHPAGATLADRQYRDNIKSDMQAIFKEKIDIVHIHSSVLGFTTLVLKEASKANVPVRISHSHGKFEESFSKRVIHYFLRAYIRRKSTIYAGCSTEAGIYLFGRRGINSPKWHRIPNAIQTENFSFSKTERKLHREDLHLEDDEVLLGAVGYLDEVKNHSFLIDLMDSLKQSGISCKLVILGDGRLKEELTEKIRLRDLSQSIILYGKTDDVSCWLSAMDIYVMPSLSEGLPISAIEAQTSGLPCMLSDRITKEVDIISSVTHLPIDKGTGIWEKKIKKLYNTVIRPERIAIRSKARQIVADAGFDVSSLKNEISEMYGIHITP